MKYRILAFLFFLNCALLWVCVHLASRPPVSFWTKLSLFGLIFAYWPMLYGYFKFTADDHIKTQGPKSDQIQESPKNSKEII